MWFKKNKLTTQKNTPFKNNIEKYTFIKNLVWVISLCLIFLLWFILIWDLKFFNLIIDKNNTINLNNTKTEKDKWINNQKEKDVDIINKVEEENQKEKINILIIWRWWWDHEAPNLTDTIILASINSKSKIISMLSIPRDLYIEYPWKENWKINWLFAKYNSKTEHNWISVLKDKITELTWEEIDYHINIDFNWFTKIIDTIWWIQITIPEDFVDNKYPDSNWWYKTLTFKKWTWIFDGDNALKYARSRHSTSDYDRSLRQQQVIKAIKDKLTWNYFLTSPLKLKELYNVFIEYVDTDLKLATILKLAYNLNWKWDFKIISSNLNDSCLPWSLICTKWSFLYTPNRSNFWWMSVSLIEWSTIGNLSNYDILHKYSNIVFNFSWIFDENYIINVFNWAKLGSVAWDISVELSRYWFNIPDKSSIWNTPELYEKTVIYYNNIDENSDTIKWLKQFFNWEYIKSDTPIISKNNANIEIIIWKDYKLKDKQFKF